MEISGTLKKAIEEKNADSLHSIFYTIAHEDPAFSTKKFEDTLEYVKGFNIPGLINQHNGQAELDEREWDEDYWAQVASELHDNFSEERVSHLITIGNKVYGKKAETEAIQETKLGKTEESYDDKKVETSDITNKTGTKKVASSNWWEEERFWFWVVVIGIFLLLLRLFRRRK